MRKNLIAMSVATLVAGLGMAGGAAANVLLDNGAATISPSNATFQEVRPGGIGHQLIIPYFTSQGSNNTLINLVNTDGINGKAVKVRFRGGSNSDDLFDFQVYLSPNDMWTANISRNANGFSVLTTTDNSCTIPTKANLSGQPFSVLRFLPVVASSEQTREGYVEIFNMADVPPFAINADGSASTTVNNPTFTATKHVGGTPPCTSAVINSLNLDPPNLAAAYNLGMRAPTGSLFANWTIIDVANSGVTTGEATALVATIGAGGAAGNGNIVFSPQLGTNANGVGNAGQEPATSAALVVDQMTSDPLFRTTNGGVNGVGIGDATNSTTGRTLPRIQAKRFDLPDLSTPYLSSQFPLSVASPVLQAETLTRALAARQIMNEFLTDPNIFARTDWVLSMPTRRYSVAMDYVAPAIRVFTRFPNRDFFTAANTTLSGNQICVSLGTGALNWWDREESTPSAPPADFVISPATGTPPSVLNLCGETTVMSWTNTSGATVLSPSVATSSPGSSFVTGNIRDGWARLITTGLSTGAGVFDATGNGLPILGKAFVKAENPAVRPGVAAGFGASWEHRFTRPVTP